MTQKFEVIVYIESTRIICDSESDAESEADQQQRLHNAYTVIRSIEVDDEEIDKEDCISWNNKRIECNHKINTCKGCDLYQTEKG
jgi:hypothetical protein